VPIKPPELPFGIKTRTMERVARALALRFLPVARDIQVKQGRQNPWLSRRSVDEGVRMDEVGEAAELAPRLSFLLWLSWTLANSVAGALGGAIIQVMGLSGGWLFGIPGGLAQWLVLRRYLRVSP
jgi:hypothetical protein